MKTLNEFYKLTDIEDYFDFFGLEYDEHLIDVKRFHILRKFGELVAKAKTLEGLSEEQLLNSYQFALIKIYKDFESGYNPSAAEVWGLFENPTPCFTCSTQMSCKTEDHGVSHGNCQSQIQLSFS